MLVTFLFYSIWIQLLTVIGWLSLFFSVVIGVLTKISFISVSTGTSRMSFTLIDCRTSKILGVCVPSSLYIPLTNSRNFFI